MSISDTTGEGSIYRQLGFGFFVWSGRVGPQVVVRSPVTIDDATTVIVTAMNAADASRKLLNDVSAFVKSLRGQGVHELDDIQNAHILSFVNEHTFSRGKARTALNAARPRSATMRNRLWAVSEFFSTARMLNLTDRAVGIDLKLPPRGVRLTRPLTDAEVWTCEQVAQPNLFTNRSPAVLALAEAGAAPAEIAAVRLQDVDLNRGTVWFLGARAHILPRLNQLTDWGIEAIGRHIARVELSSTSPLVVAAGTVGESGTASVSGELRDILNRAGLGDDSTVKPQSIRAWSGRGVFDQSGNLIAVAEWLGVASFDQAAEIIGLHREAP